MRHGVRFGPQTNFNLLKKTNLMKSFSSSSLYNNEDILKSISDVEVQINNVSYSITEVENQIIDLEIPIKNLLDKPNLSKEEEEKKKYFLEEKASLRESLRRKEDKLSVEVSGTA